MAPEVSAYVATYQAETRHCFRYCNVTMAPEVNAYVDRYQAKTRTKFLTVRETITDMQM